MRPIRLPAPDPCRHRARCVRRSSHRAARTRTTSTNEASKRSGGNAC